MAELNVSDYTEGQEVRVDLFLCGFPAGRVVEVISPGNGRQATEGKIRVELLESVKGYRHRESVLVAASDAVPLPHVIIRDGRYRINVNYRWVTNPKKVKK